MKVRGRKRKQASDKKCLLGQTYWWFMRGCKYCSPNTCGVLPPLPKLFSFKGGGSVDGCLFA